MAGEGMKLIDAHIHLDFYDNFDYVLDKIITLDMQTIFVTHLPELFKRYNSQIGILPNISLALGFHPILIREYDLNTQLFLEQMVETNFIGEVGLDYSISSSQVTRAKQREAFSFICQNANNKILSVHSRLAEKDVLYILKDNGVKKAIFHWYTGNENLLMKIIEQGYYFSVNHMMLHSNKGINILKQIPLNRLLIETDGPFTKYGDKIVSPVDLFHIYNDFSEFYQTDKLAQIIWENYSLLIE